MCYLEKTNILNMLDMQRNGSQIGIISFITYSSHLNYGATLHGYAFQRFLKRYFGLNSIILKYIPKAIQKENLKNPILNPWKLTQFKSYYQRGLTEGAKLFLNNILRSINWLIQINGNRNKWLKFQSFISTKLCSTKKTYTYDDLQSSQRLEGLDFKMFICESDVIWKFKSIDQIDENFFLTFPAAENCVKIAYAPSIAKREMTNEDIKKFEELVKPFYAISARDQVAAQYLKNILKRDCEYVLDPTLLLDEKDYEDLITLPEFKDDYLLIYNCTANDTKMVKKACQFAKERNLKVVEISNYAINRYLINHIVVNNAGIEEWLGWFKKAKFIITNSFHGICFSIIFKKNFYVYQRDNSDYRFTDILKNLNIEKTLIPYDKKNLELKGVEIDYTEVYSELDILRKKSISFIEKSIVQNS